MSSLMKVVLSCLIAFLLWGIGLSMGADFQETRDHEKAFQERVKEHACEIRQIDTGTICIQPDGRIFTK